MQKLPVCDLYQVKFMEFHYMKNVLCVLIIQEMSFTSSSCGGSRGGVAR